MRKLLVTLTVFALLTAWPQEVRADHVTLREGSAIQVRLLERLDSETDNRGHYFDAELDEELVQDGSLLASRGSRVVGQLTEVSGSRKVKGRAVLEMTLREIHVDGKVYPLETSKLRIEAEGSKGEDAKVIGGGAGIGALLGALIGGKKGALIGATIGAGAGTTAVLMTDGEEVVLQPEQRIQFTLLDDVQFSSLGSAERETDIGSDNPISRNQAVSPEPSPELSNQLAALAAEIDEMAADFRYGSLDAALRRERTERTATEADENSRALEFFLLLGEYSRSVELVADLAERHSPYSLRAAKELLQQKHWQVNSVYQEVGADGEMAAHWRQVAQLFHDVQSTFDEASVANLEGRFHWRGIVDGTDEIIVRDNFVQIRHLRGKEIYNAVYELSAPIPRHRLDHLELKPLDGRGQIVLVQEPTQQNNYVAVVQISDDAGGADFYEFELNWR